MEKEEILLSKRFQELAANALKREVCFYTDFLNLNELTLFYAVQQDKKYLGNSHISHQLWGGFHMAERKMICFYTEDLSDEPKFPIDSLTITPRQEKFSEELTHRDYLGAILNLGIERCKIGDILINDKSAIVFCHKSISDYMISQLERIRHTSISVSFCLDTDIHYTPHFTEVTGTVSSVRLDAVLSVAFKNSRSSLIAFINGKKVFVNSRLVLSNSYVLKEGDIVSVRGLGRFIFQGIKNQTKKGRFFVTLLKY